jgi:hypothetical protein
LEKDTRPNPQDLQQSSLKKHNKTPPVKEENKDHAEDYAEGVNPDQAHSIEDSSRPTRDIPIQDSISSYFSLHQHMFSKSSPQFTINRNHLAVNA